MGYLFRRAYIIAKAESANTAIAVCVMVKASRMGFSVRAIEYRQTPIYGLKAEANNAPCGQRVPSQSLQLLKRFHCPFMLSTHKS